MPTVETKEAHPAQAELLRLDVEGQKLNPNWVDEKQPLFVPRNPLHYKAHRLQILLERMDKQATTRPTAFNSANYITALNAYTDCIIKIINGDDKAETDTLDTPEVAGNISRSQNQAPVYNPLPAGVDSGVSAEDPFSG